MGYRSVKRRNTHKRRNTRKRRSVKRRNTHKRGGIGPSSLSGRPRQSTTTTSEPKQRVTKKSPPLVKKVLTQSLNKNTEFLKYMKDKKAKEEAKKLQEKTSNHSDKESARMRRIFMTGVELPSMKGESKPSRKSKSRAPTLDAFAEEE